VKHSGGETLDALGWRASGRADYEVPALELNEAEQTLLSALVDAYDEAKEDAAAELKRLLKKHCAERNILLGRESAERVLRAALANAVGFGPFDALLADDDLEEIAFTGVGQPIRVYHRTRGWLETNCAVTAKDFAVNTANKMARPLGRRLTAQNPRLNAVLPNGSRLHASIAPLTTNGAELTLRKFKEKPFTVPDLAANGTLPLDAAAFLWLALYGDTSLVIAGSTGSGKTTTLNALFSFIPLNERIIITEETPEISIPHKHCVRLVANAELGITLKELVKDTLRMRPDRVIIGEVRDEGETAALFDSLLAGQARGSYATFHAASGGEALARFEALGARPADLKALDLLLVQQRVLVYDAKTRRQRESRRVTELDLVQDGEAVPLFAYDAAKGALAKTRRYGGNALFERLEANYGMNASALQKEAEKRCSHLQKLGGAPNFAEAVNAYLFG